MFTTLAELFEFEEFLSLLERLSLLEGDSMTTPSSSLDH
jgi:hypothetical protein